MSYKQYFTLICILGWSATVIAAQSNIESLQQLPWMSIVISGFISLWGGLIATLQKLTEVTLRQKILHMEIVKDLLASMASGFIAYNFGMWGDWNVWLLASALLVAGYGGSKILDALLNRTIKQIEETNVTVDYTKKD